MRGTIVRRGTVAEFVIIATQAGDYAVVELFGDELDVGEAVSGPLDEEGSVTLVRVADGTRIDCMIQWGGVTLAAATAALQRMGG